jgi:hypothetical protein
MAQWQSVRLVSERSIVRSCLGALPFWMAAAQTVCFSSFSFCNLLNCSSRLPCTPCACQYSSVLLVCKGTVHAVQTVSHFPAFAFSAGTRNLTGKNEYNNPCSTHNLHNLSLLPLPRQLRRAVSLRVHLALLGPAQRVEVGGFEEVGSDCIDVEKRQRHHRERRRERKGKGKESKTHPRATTPA